MDDCGRKFDTKEKLDDHIKLRHPSTSDKNINKDKNETKGTEKTKDKLEKEKNKIILDDLYSKINSLENYFENENLELQKQFEIAEMPLMEDILTEQKEIKIPKENKDINNSYKYDLNEAQKNYDKDKIITITEELILSNSDIKNDDFEEITVLNLSKKNIASFMNNRNVNFSEIPNLKKLILSCNWMTYTYDLRLFLNLEEIYINDNRIDDISFCEYLPNLKILNCENNEITYITSLKKSQKLKILKLSQNKIQYLNSTLGVFKSLNLLEELTIKDNPFLSQIFAYKHYFLFEYQNLLKLDNEEINDIDRDIAGRFVRQNNTMYKNTPLYNTVHTEDENKMSGDEANLKDTFRVGNAIITKEMVIPYKSKGKYNLNDMKNNKTENKRNKEENNKTKELKEIIKSQKKEIDDIKLELENINQLNKEYEIIIEEYKFKLDQKKTRKNKNINTNNNINNKEEEKIKLLKELEMWKKEYLDLFNKTNQASLFPSLLTKDPVHNPKSHFLKKSTEEENQPNDNTTNMNSSPKNKKIIQRPQTAQVRKTNPDNFEGLCQGLKIMYSKNRLMDVLEEESDYEEEKENNAKDEIDYDGNDIIPDDEIDELFRKSCADLQKMKEDIKYLNESIDKNVNNKGSKTKLNPVIIKKENNPNFIGNKTIFGNLNKKK